MDTEKFINSFRAEASLLNTFCEDYKNKNIRKAALGGLAAEFNISGLVLSIFLVSSFVSFSFLMRHKQLLLQQEVQHSCLSFHFINHG